MIRVYISENGLTEAQEDNDSFFDYNILNKVKITKEHKQIIKDIEDCTSDDNFNFKSKFNGSNISQQYLSTGTKTALNCLHFPDKLFSVEECGPNAIEAIFRLPEAKIYHLTTVPIIDTDRLPSSGTLNIELHIHNDVVYLNDYDDLIEEIRHHGRDY